MGGRRSRRKSLEGHGGASRKYRRLCESPASSSDATQLGSLLEQEDYLLKVLGYLVADGLHECRRVCRHWNDICSELPVKVYAKGDDMLPKIVDMFPNADSMTVKSFADRSADGFGDRTLDMLRKLAQLNSLKNLTVNAVQCWPVSSPIEPEMHWLKGLQSLDLTLTNAESVVDLYESLSLMEGLTHLKLAAPKPRNIKLPKQTELHLIQDLKLRTTLLIDEEGELLFPSLTHLTKLDAFVDAETSRLRNGLFHVRRTFLFAFSLLFAC